MRVRELIQQLHRFEPDAEVVTISMRRRVTPRLGVALDERDEPCLVITDTDPFPGSLPVCLLERRRA